MIVHFLNLSNTIVFNKLVFTFSHLIIFKMFINNTNLCLERTSIGTLLIDHLIQQRFSCF